MPCVPTKCVSKFDKNHNSATSRKQLRYYINIVNYVTYVLQYRMKYRNKNQTSGNILDIFLFITDLL